MTDIKKAIWHRRFYNAKEGVKTAAVNTGRWIADNKEFLIVAIPVVIGGVSEVRRFGSKIEERAEINRKKREIYNPSIHRNVRLKRSMTSNQQREFSRRQNAGESISDILIDMNLI